MKLRCLIKTVCYFLFTLFIVINSCDTVIADVIWTPNDDFYLNNASQCTTLGRSYTANGVDGNITLWKSPVTNKKVATYENGTLFYVSVTYTDEKEETWGVIEIDGKTGWTKMKNLLLVYDNISFCEEHEKDFQDYIGEFDNYVIDTPIFLWTYPGSGEVLNSFTVFNDKKIPFDYTYTDIDGRQWGYIPYYYCNKGWVCLSDPTNEKLPLHKGVVTEKQTSGTDKSSKNGPDSNSTADTSKELIFLSTAILAIIIITGVLIRVLWKKNETGSKK